MWLVFLMRDSAEMTVERFEDPERVLRVFCRSSVECVDHVKAGVLQSSAASRERVLCLVYWVAETSKLPFDTIFERVQRRNASCEYGYGSGEDEEGHGESHFAHFSWSFHFPCLEI